VSNICRLLPCCIEAFRPGCRGVLAVLLAVLFSLGAERAVAAAPAVAAASDLQFALTEIVARFEVHQQRKVRLSFGSSGNFKRQILQGAPFELYLSADESYVKDLARAGLTRDAGTLYALGRIALLVPAGSEIVLDAQFEDLRRAIGDNRLQRFAIANPEHAPYGRAAREALQSVGLWRLIKPHLVLGENASQAARFAVSGSTQGGIIPYSLALVPAVSKGSRYLLLPAAMHSPLRQRMVLLRNAGPVAQALYAYIQSAEARKILLRYGFQLHGD